MDLIFHFKPVLLKNWFFERAGGSALEADFWTLSFRSIQIWVFVRPLKAHIYCNKKTPWHQISEPRPIDSGSLGSGCGAKNCSADIQACWSPDSKTLWGGGSQSLGFSPSPNVYNAILFSGSWVLRAQVGRPRPATAMLQTFYCSVEVVPSEREREKADSDLTHGGVHQK